MSSVIVGSLWRGASGNLLLVLEVEGDRALIAYVRDPDDSCWESVEDIVRWFEPVP